MHLKSPQTSNKIIECFLFKRVLDGQVDIRQRRLRYMECTVHDLEVAGSNPGWVAPGVTW